MCTPVKLLCVVLLYSSVLCCIKNLFVRTLEHFKLPCLIVNQGYLSVTSFLRFSLFLSFL